MRRAPLRRPLALTLAALMLLLGAPVSLAAKAKKGGPPRTIALFPFISRDAPNKKIMASVNSLLVQGAGLMDGLTVLHGTPLKRRLRKNPAVVVQKCGTDLACLAALGKRAKAQEVMLVRAATEGGDGVKLSFLIIDVRTKDVARKMSLVFNTPDDVKPVLGEAFFEIYGVTDPGTLEIQGAQGVVMVDGAEVGSGPGPYSVPPGMREVVANGRKQNVMVQPNKKRTIQAADGEPTGDMPAEPPLVASAPPASDAKAGKGAVNGASRPQEAMEDTDAADEPPLVAMADMPLDLPAEDEPVEASSDTSTETLSATSGETEVALVDPALPPPVEPSGGPGALTWVGAGVAAVGVGLMAGAAGLYFPASDTLSALDAQRASGNFTTSQIDAVERSNGALANYDLSQGLFYGGLAAAVVGGALVAVDLFVLNAEPAVPQTRVSVGPGSAALWLHWAW